MSAETRTKEEYSPRDTFQRIAKESARRVQQKRRFRTLEILVSKLFRKRSETMEISSAIISFITLSGRSDYSSFPCEIQDIPFEEADEEVKKILREEFLNPPDHTRTMQIQSERR